MPDEGSLAKPPGLQPRSTKGKQGINSGKADTLVWSLTKDYMNHLHKAQRLSQHPIDRQSLDWCKRSTKKPHPYANSTPLKETKKGRRSTWANIRDWGRPTQIQATTDIGTICWTSLISIQVMHFGLHSTENYCHELQDRHTLLLKNWLQIRQGS